MKKCTSLVVILVVVFFGNVCRKNDFREHKMNLEDMNYVWSTERGEGEELSRFLGIAPIRTYCCLSLDRKKGLAIVKFAEGSSEEYMLDIKSGLENEIELAYKGRVRKGKLILDGAPNPEWVYFDLQNEKGEWHSIAAFGRKPSENWTLEQCWSLMMNQAKIDKSISSVPAQQD